LQKIQIEKEETKISLFDDKMFVTIRTHKKNTKDTPKINKQLTRASIHS
jgi:uncharacterized protein YneF (UPF0154 family)